MKRFNWRLTAVILLAAVLRCLFLQSRGIQYDDAFSIFLSRRSLVEIISGTAADTMPPLYYFLLHFWGLVSQELWWLRLLSVLLSLGCVVLVYLLVRRLAKENAALAAALLAAVSPLQIYHAQDLRMYALATLAVLASWYFFLRLFQTDGITKAQDWIGLILTSSAALYSHNLAGFLLIPPFAFLLWRCQWKWLVKFAAAQAITLITFGPWLILLPGQVEKIQRAFWTPRPGIVEIIQAAMLGAANLPLEGIWMGVGLALSLGAVLLVLVELIRGRKKAGDLSFLTWCAFLPGLVLFVLSYLMRPVFVPRGFLAAYLSLEGLAGWAIWQAWRKGGGKILLGLFVLAALISLPTQYTFDQFPRSPFKQAMQDLSKELNTGDIILHDNKLSFFPAAYYAPGLPQRFLADQPGSINDTYADGSQRAMQIIPAADLESGVEGAQRVIFIFFSQTLNEYLAAGESEHPAVTWLSQHGELEKTENWNDLQAYFFTMR